MVVAFQGMTVDAGIIVAVAGDELLQVGSGFGQVFDVEATSSMRQVVPGWRVPPTDGNIPERMAQYLEYSSGRR